MYVQALRPKSAAPFLWAVSNSRLCVGVSMKLGYAIVFMIIVIAAFVIGTRFRVAHALIQHPRAISGLEQIHRLNLQKMCSEQAAKAFNDMRFMPHDFNNSFLDHYNEKLGKCFILIHIFNIDNHRMTIAESLSDAFGGADYGDYYNWHYTSDPIPGIDHIVMCDRKPDGINSQEPCKSHEEWDSYTARYMKD